MSDPNPSPSSRCEALLYGLNYASQPRLRLNGCWNDAIGMSSLLTSEPYCFDPERVHVVMDTNNDQVPRCTKHAIASSLQSMARRSREGAGLDVAVFAFSGHGSHQRDYSGDEADGQDEGICPIDCMRTGLLLDDDLLRIVKEFNPRTRLYMVFDCCHSGSMLDLPFVYPPGVDLPDRAPTLPDPCPRIVMLSGCRDSQTSADAFDRRTRQFGGALTMSLLRVLQSRGADEPPLGLIELHERVSGLLKADGYTQYPLISSTVPITDEERFLV